MTRSFQRYAWAFLAYVVVVILWGAFVRATGSGAGCGSHWPLCNGEVVPRSPTMSTLIELGHRMTSGAAGIAVFVQLVWSRRAYPRGHRVRHAVAWATLFMVLEAAIGAKIVLREYVTDNASMGRAVTMVVHLVNTFFLLGALTLAALWSSGNVGVRLRGHGMPAALGLVALIGTLFVGASGAIAALGDTLFPASDLGSALAADLSTTAHVLVRLRIIHPVLAVIVAFVTLGVRFTLCARNEDVPEVQRWGTAVRAIIVVQLAVGLLNMTLLAPVWMQLVHLLLADALWISLVCFVATALAESRVAAVNAEADGGMGPLRTDGETHEDNRHLDTRSGSGAGV